MYRKGGSLTISLRHPSAALSEKYTATITLGRLSRGSRSLPAPGDGDHGDDDQTGQDQANAGAEAVGVEHGHDQEQEHRGAPESGDIGEPAGNRRAADHHDGDRGEEIFA